jgi:hypothetical protein
MIPYMVACRSPHAPPLIIDMAQTKEPFHHFTLVKDPSGLTNGQDVIGLELYRPSPSLLPIYVTESG